MPTFPSAFRSFFLECVSHSRSGSIRPNSGNSIKRGFQSIEGRFCIPTVPSKRAFLLEMSFEFSLDGVSVVAENIVGDGCSVAKALFEEAQDLVLVLFVHQG